MLRHFPNPLITSVSVVSKSLMNISDIHYALNKSKSRERCFRSIFFCRDHFRNITPPSSISFFRNNPCRYLHYKGNDGAFEDKHIDIDEMIQKEKEEQFASHSLSSVLKNNDVNENIPLLKKRQDKKNLATLLSSELSSQTAYFRGTLFELLTMHSLKDIGFNVDRTGAAYDGGVDFRGIWELNSNRKKEKTQLMSTSIGDGSSLKCHSRSSSVKAPVIGQCKFTSRPIGAKYLREFDGTLSQESEGHVGIFVSSTLFSSEAKNYFMQMSHPAILITLTYSEGLLLKVKRFMSRLASEKIQSKEDADQLITELFENSLAMTTFRMNPLSKERFPNVMIATKYTKLSNSSRKKCVVVEYA